MTSKSNINEFLLSLELNGIGQKLGKVGRILKNECSDSTISVIVEIHFPVGESANLIKTQIESDLRIYSGLPSVDVSLVSKISSHAVQSNIKPISGIKNIIAIASGKGGVGKSTIAVNTALALSMSGASVGILDADIYGPSQPQMLGLDGERPISKDGKSILPLENHNIKVMSIGFLIDSDQPMVWRGPMVTTALKQLMYQTVWGELDYLIIDMPPGTGDIQLTLSQKIPVSGAVIVTTPQKIATIDARKGLAMFQKVSISVLGVVENMSAHICSSCGRVDTIFGNGGADEMRKDFEIPILGSLPLLSSIREQTDSGLPTVLAEPNSVAAQAFKDTALQIAVAQAIQRSDYSSKFGNIVVEEKE
ncbi:MAG: iron-sulfur cluster carrier protein ApbC [Gammaproteobacteria bacterium]|nr:iron-sulfur cluster carrier protein ApbC [Gammaproteobacteria bacterium]